MGWFSRGIDIESGILDAEGYFRTGRRPRVGRPPAEIYELSEPDEAPSLWWLREQEKLSRAARWGDDYFRIWAEILALGIADGDIAVAAAWIVVVHDARGLPVSCVEYRPILDRKGFLDVGYEDAGWRLSAAR